MSIFHDIAEREKMMAAQLTPASFFATSQAIADELPQSKAVEEKHADSNTVTETWKRGGCPWHHH
jgi:hypothetical protein